MCEEACYEALTCGKVLYIRMKRMHSNRVEVTVVVAKQENFKLLSFAALHCFHINMCIAWEEKRQD